MKSNELLKNILGPFPNNKPPEDDSLIRSILPDSLKLKEDFKGKKWQEVSNETVADHFDNLPLFTPEAFIYYIPAYIRSILEYDYAYLTIAEFLVYCFTPGGNKNTALWKAERMKKFKNDQLQYLATFFGFLLEDSKFKSINEDILIGLSELNKYKK